LIGQKGITFYSPDSSRSVGLKLMMQSRMTINQENDRNLQLNRFRVIMSSKLSNRLRFNAHLFFDGPNKITLPEESTLARLLFDAFAEYDLSDHLILKAGQFNLMGSLEFITIAAQLEFVDRSILKRRFAYGRDRGVMLEYTKKMGSQGFKLFGSITSGENWRYDNGNLGGFLYLARAEYYPFGFFKNNRVYEEGAFTRNESFKLMLSLGYEFNEDAGRSNNLSGSFQKFAGEYVLNNFYTTHGNVIMKYKRFAFQSNLIYQLTDSDNADIGFNNQLSFMAPKGYHFSLRYASDSYYISNTANVWDKEYRVGVSKFLTPDFKIQADYGLENLEFNDDLYELRLQMQVTM